MVSTYARRRDPTKTMVSVAAVGLLHVVLIGSITYALQTRALDVKPPVHEVTLIPEQPKPIEEHVVKTVELKPDQSPFIPIPTTDFTVKPASSSREAPTGTTETANAGPIPTHGPIATPAKIDAKACTPPDYPAGARRLGHDGLTVLDMLIGADGLVKEAKIRTTSGYTQLDTAALSALSLCRFTPGTVDGKPVEGWNAIQYRWKLQ